MNHARFFSRTLLLATFLSSGVLHAALAQESSDAGRRPPALNAPAGTVAAPQAAPREEGVMGRVSSFFSSEEPQEPRRRPGMNAPVVQESAPAAPERDAEVPTVTGGAPGGGRNGFFSGVFMRDGAPQARVPVGNAEAEAVAESGASPLPDSIAKVAPVESVETSASPAKEYPTLADVPPAPDRRGAAELSKQEMESLRAVSDEEVREREKTAERAVEPPPMQLRPPAEMSSDEVAAKIPPVVLPEPAAPRELAAPQEPGETEDEGDFFSWLKRPFQSDDDAQEDAVPQQAMPAEPPMQLRPIENGATELSASPAAAGSPEVPASLPAPERPMRLRPVENGAAELSSPPAAVEVPEVPETPLAQPAPEQAAPAEQPMRLRPIENGSTELLPPPAVTPSSQVAPEPAAIAAPLPPAPEYAPAPPEEIAPMPPTAAVSETAVMPSAGDQGIVLTPPAEAHVLSTLSESRYARRRAVHRRPSPE